MQVGITDVIRDVPIWTGLIKTLDKCQYISLPVSLGAACTGRVLTVRLFRKGSATDSGRVAYDLRRAPDRRAVCSLHSRSLIALVTRRSRHRSSITRYPRYGRCLTHCGANAGNNCRKVRGVHALCYPWHTREEVSLRRPDISVHEVSLVVFMDV